MADSVREQIAQALLTRLATITVANGYQTNLGPRIGRAVRSLDRAKLPAGSLWLGSEDGETNYHVIRHVMDVVIEAHALTGAETADAVANRLLADLRRAMETHDATLAALVTGISYSGANPQYPEDGGGLVAVSARYRVGYQTERGDPY